MDGILNIDKPYGKTSFGIVSLIKRLTGQRHAGHAGTLDPMATGVLPICLGRGTRVTEFLMDATKAYRAEIELGVATDTYDSSGKITQRGDTSGINLEQLREAFSSFCGSIRQTPPMYSAVRHLGKPLYVWARAGIEIERKSRPAEIYHLEIVDWQTPVVTIEVVCGKGTYIRSLAHDVGQCLGCGANLKSLIRLRCGPFEIRDSISVTQLEDAFHNSYWQQYIYPIDAVLLHWKAVVVNDNTGDAIKNGRPIILNRCYPIDPTGHTGYFSSALFNLDNRCRVYTLDGSFLGVLRFNADSEQWQPQKVFL